MTFPSTQSFTPLAELHLPKSYTLHPDACNPVMDLIALIHTPESGTSIKGKGKASTEGCKVALWRMTGSKVWEVDIDGLISGLAWGIDGLHLSLLVTPIIEGHIDGYTLQHRSVHDGSLIRITPVSQAESMSPESLDDLRNGSRWWKMEWRSSDLAWGKPKPGSALMIIDSLPTPTPVEPPPPPITMQRSLQKSTTTSKTNLPPHPKLHTFPTLLPSSTQTAPDILHISPPRTLTSQSFLTGTFPLSSSLSAKPSHSILTFSKMSEKLTSYFEIIFRGLESAQHAFGEGQKQSMIWREELETCGEQQGLTKVDVHADLFRLLMTGRGGVAVAEWLGNRLTGRTITKWETALDTSFSTIRKVIIESITPALERIVLILEELIGWSKCLPLHKGIALESKTITDLIHLACETIKLVEKMRQLATHELHASMEFMKWLKFETGRAARDVSQDAAIGSNYDLKYTWAYMKSGFVESPFIKHFPLTADKPPKEVLPHDSITFTKPSHRKLGDAIQHSLDALARSGKHTNLGDLASPEQGDQSVYSSMALTDAEAISMSEVVDSPGSSDSEDTVERRKPEKEVVRNLKSEPWIWVNTLLKGCEDMVSGAVRGSERGVNTVCLDPGGDSLFTEVVNGDTWIAFVPTGRGPQSLWLLRIPNDETTSASLSVLALEGGGDSKTACLAIEFFDDVELVLLLESGVGGERQRHLITMLYADLDMEDIPRPQRDLGQLAAEADDGFLRSSSPLAIHRCRVLTIPGVQDGIVEKVSLALNGRKGRRVGCVSMGDGRGVEVFDMDEDEDEDDDEDEGGEDEEVEVGDEDGEMSGVEEE